MAMKPSASTQETARDRRRRLLRLPTRRSSPANAGEPDNGSTAGESITRRRAVQLLIFAGGAAAGFAGKTTQEFFTPQDAADQVRTVIGPSNPLGVTAIPDHYPETQRLIWVLPDALPSTGVAVPNYDDPSFDKWVARHRGVDLWFTYVKLIIENRWSNPVSIAGIRAQVKRQAPLHGTLLWMPPQGAGVLNQFGFNLDDPQPGARVAVDNLEEVIQSGTRDMNAFLTRSSYLSRHKVDLAHRERETFEVIAGTTQNYCEFTIEVTGMVGQKPFTQEISYLGEPFKVTAPARPTSNSNDLDQSAYGVVYENNFQGWRRTKG